MKERFDHNCKTPEEAAAYLDARSKQLLRLGYTKTETTTHEWGAQMLTQKDGETFQSIYIVEGHRGKGLYPTLVRHRILTSFSFQTNFGCYRTWHEYLHEKGIDYHIENVEPWGEYKMISRHYGGETAKRSGVQLMNHIDEGLAVLEWIGASETAKRAYCLHPMLQSDDDLARHFNELAGTETRIGIQTVTSCAPTVAIAATEYRSVANEYLSTRSIQGIDEIRLSPLKDVNDMLIADKIQNRKDFETYHHGKHPRTEELDRYFRNWLERLGVSEELYQETKARIL